MARFRIRQEGRPACILEIDLDNGLSQGPVFCCTKGIKSPTLTTTLKTQGTRVQEQRPKYRLCSNYVLKG